MTSLLSLLGSVGGRSLHLPVHGRGSALPPSLKRLLRQPPGRWDLPELPEIGGPLEGEGAVAASQVRLAAALGVDRCWFGVNGATGLLQAALLGMAQPGEAVLLPRNVHRSLIAACELGGVMPVFLPVPFLADRGHPGAMTVASLRQSLDALPNPGRRIAAAVLVHPTYHGYAAEISGLLDLLHTRGLPVLVDEAHGTHLAFPSRSALPVSAVHAGADLVVHSLHKSAPGLAQTAVLWQRNGRIDPERLQAALQRLQTTSPSALLLASCEATLDWMLSQRWPLLLEACRRDATTLATVLARAGVPLHSSDDPLRLILATGQAGISGLQADDWFMQRGVIAELPEPLCLTFCLGFAQHRGFTRQFRHLWKQLLAEVGGKPLAPIPAPPCDHVSVPVLPPDEALRRPVIRLPVGRCTDRIAAELICPYPPGVPLLVPGERMDAQRCAWLDQQHRRWPDQVPGKVNVLA